MSFTPEQIGELSAPLSRAHVKSREQGGRQVSYIEGWLVIAEANRIFGFDAWDRETVECKCVAERETKIGQRQEDGWRVGYIAKVRVTVWSADSARPVVREGTGYGSGIDRDLGAAHESATKEAETDAAKRALMTFGNPFGLALYDKTQAEVEPMPRPAAKPADDRYNPNRQSPPQYPPNKIAAETAAAARLPVSPEEPPHITAARDANRARFWTRESYAIDPAVIAGGLGAWDAEMLAQAGSAKGLDAVLKLKEDNRPHFQRWAKAVQEPVVTSFRDKLGAIEARLAKAEERAA